jgi:hypothetical protein
LLHGRGAVLGPQRRMNRSLIGVIARATPASMLPAPQTAVVTLVDTVRSEWRFGLAALAASRLALTLVGVLATTLLSIGFRHLELLPGVPLLDMWAQWDAEHYVNIAVTGYEPPTASFSNIAFFPLYPLLIRLVLVAIGRVDVETGAFVGLVIANVALFVALLYLSALISRDFNMSLARRTVIYLLVFPTTLFLSSAYAESLFLATAAASLYHARAGQWYRAGIFGLLAALTRPFGLLLVVPIALELWRQRSPARAWPAVLGPPLGLGMFVGYLWWLFGDPLAYFSAGASWGRGIHAPWEVALAYLRGPLQAFDWPYSWLDGISMVIMAVLAVASWRLLPVSYAGYATAGVVFAMSTGMAWFSASRHALALFPVIIVLAVAGQRWRWFEYSWLSVSILLTVAFMARVAGGYWVT